MTSSRTGVVCLSAPPGWHRSWAEAASAVPVGASSNVNVSEENTEGQFFLGGLSQRPPVRYLMFHVGVLSRVHSKAVTMVSLEIIIYLLELKLEWTFP